MSMSDTYWQECIECALEEEGIEATAEQIENIAAAVRISHENYGLYSGNDVFTSNRWGTLEREKEDLNKAHEAELMRLEASHREDMDAHSDSLRRLRRRIEELQERLQETSHE